MKWNELDSKICSVKRSLSILGDRWTLVIIRDAFFGATRFSDFLETSGVPKHRLADRLARLVESEILEKRAQSSRHLSYHLTAKGRDLLPVLLALVQWGDKYLDDGDGAPLKHYHEPCGSEIKPVGVCHDCGDKITPESYQVKFGSGIKAKLARGESVPEMAVLAKLQEKEVSL